MIRTALIVLATLGTIATVTPAAAQAGAPVRTLGSSDAANTTVVITARKAQACFDKSCAVKPLKREAYVAPPSFGW